MEAHFTEVKQFEILLVTLGFPLTYLGEFIDEDPKSALVDEGIMIALTG
jgi:hypothetical protein